MAPEIKQFNRGVVFLGDAIDTIKLLPDGYVDAVITDPPYGTTACKWDAIIPFAPMWEQLDRVTPKNAAIILFTSQPFTSALVLSNPKRFKYEWIWKKSKASNFLNAKIEPLKEHETIAVFCDKRTYYPQDLKPYGKVRSRKSAKGTSDNYGSYGLENVSEFTNYPRTIQEFALDKPCGHPTQKPVDLLRYLIRTYTKPDEIVLDFTMGSGTTCVAAVCEGRQFIGIEKEQRYFDIACERIAEAESK